MKLTEAEWVIMNALWREYPATARDIARRLPAEVSWAYTTIKTMLSRLAEKKAVREDKQGNTSVYAPIVSRQKAQRSEIMRTLKRAFDGTLTPMMQFLIENEELSEKEYRHLERLIKNRKRRKAGSRKGRQDFDDKVVRRRL